MRTILVLILLCFSIIGYAQSFIISDNDSTITTEYDDGKLWAYRHSNEYIVGLSCYEAKDDYGKYYQIQLYINNLDSLSVIFDPDEVNAHLINKKGDTISLEVYTNEEYQKKVKQTQDLTMTLYGISAGLNAASAGRSKSYSTTHSSNGLHYTTVTTHYDPIAAQQASLAASTQMAVYRKMMEDERITKEQGYLKKNTIYPNEGIVGYMNIKRKKGHVLIINIPINGNVYSFELDVNRENKK